MAVQCLKPWLNSSFFNVRIGSTHRTHTLCYRCLRESRRLLHERLEDLWRRMFVWPSISPHCLVDFGGGGGS